MDTVICDNIDNRRPVGCGIWCEGVRNQHPRGNVGFYAVTRIIIYYDVGRR